MRARTRFGWLVLTALVAATAAWGGSVTFKRSRGYIKGYEVQDGIAVPVIGTFDEGVELNVEIGDVDDEDELVEQARRERRSRNRREYADRELLDAFFTRYYLEQLQRRQAQQAENTAPLSEPAEVPPAAEPETPPSR
jgi:hypothetical protein